MKNNTPSRADRRRSLPAVGPIRQTSNDGRAAKTLQVAQCLGIGLVLSAFVHQAGWTYFTGVRVYF